MNNRENLSFNQYQDKVFEIVRNTVIAKIANSIITDESEGDTIGTFYENGDTAAEAAISIMDEYIAFNGNGRSFPNHRRRD